MARRWRRVEFLWVMVLGSVLAGCAAAPALTTSAPVSERSHTHATGREHITPLVGDGTRGTEFGYSLERVSLPQQAGVPGTVSFQIRFEGRPVTRYIAEQTKDLHLYVVRSDLGVFRHLHPRLGSDGTWSAPVTLPEPGRYRVIAEFVARLDADNGEAVMVGMAGTVPGAPAPVAAEQPVGVVTAKIEGAWPVGPDGRLTVVVQGEGGGPVQLGSYLGTTAHVTAFNRDSGAVAHLHPLGEAVVAADGTRLTFHTEVMIPGDFLCFVQVRVDGFLYTLPIAASAR